MAGAGCKVPHLLEKMSRNSMSQQQNKPGGSAGRSANPVQAVEFLYGIRRKLATGAALLLALMLGYHIIFGQNGITIYQQKRQEAQRLQQQIQGLQQENAQLTDHVDRLKEDPDAIEHQAREELHYTRPGEVIYTLPPASNQTQATPQSQAKK
jgi:cell division protein FtsB